MKILLLNLPFKKSMLQRDLSCPHTSKANYYWPSIDLVVFSAIFSDQELELIDAIKENLNSGELIKKIKKIKPDAVLTMISAISLQEDLKIIHEFNNLGIKVGVSGDLASFEPEKLAKTGIDYIISDFTEKQKIRKAVLNKKRGVIKSSKENEFRIGIPKHELFKKYSYSLPYSYYVPVSSIITNFGCPFKCKFCNSNNLKFKKRNISEIMKEFEYLERIGIKEAYVRDFTFGVPQIEKLLKKMIEAKVKVKWSCEFRVDIANEKILRMMKKAGCYLIFYGGESGNQKTLDMIEKGFKLEQVENAIKMTKKYGMETLISFIIGFENENLKDIKNTQNFIMKINPDYTSVNILVPRIGSDFRKETRLEEQQELDNSKARGKMYNNGKFAIDYKKEIERKFFFNPKKLIRYLFLSMKSATRFKNFAKSGFSILSRV